MDYFNSKFALWFAPKGLKNWAVTFGQRTWYSVPESEVSVGWKAHEDEHKKQFAKDGFLWFLIRYNAEYLWGRMRWKGHFEAYLNISYEKAARAATVRVTK
jgi:hypothetical protein